MRTKQALDGSAQRMRDLPLFNRHRRLYRIALCSALGVSLLSPNPVGAQEPTPAETAAASQAGPSNSELAAAEAVPIDSGVVEAVQSQPSRRNIAALVEDVAGPVDTPLERSGGELVSENPSASVAIDDGQVTMEGPTGTSIGVSVGSDEAPSSIVGGAEVRLDALPDTAVVTRPTEDGVQIATVLKSEAAPSAVEYSMDLPPATKLAETEDGSIAITVPTTTLEPTPESAAKLEAQVETVVDALDAGTMTESQALTVLEAAKPVELTSVQSEQTIATIEQPWAFDANGQAIPTSYELDGNVLTQTVHTTSDTAYPVVADPSWYWWVGTAAMCASSVGLLFSGVGLTAKFAKATKIINRMPKLKAAVAKLGGLRATLSAMDNWARKFGKVNAATRAKLQVVAAFGLNMILDALGIGSCVGLVREMRK